MARNAVCICTDSTMLVPALFVAHCARRLGDSKAYEVIVFAPASILSETHHRWMAEHGIQHRSISNPDELSDVRSPFPRWSPAALYRLLLPELLGGEYDRILYCDSDTIIEQGVARLFSLELGDAPLAAVRDIPFYLSMAVGNASKGILSYFDSLPIADRNRYFNSGVLLIDIRKWCAAEIGGRAVHFLKNNPHGKWRDQTALNVTVNGGYAELSPLWNLQARGYLPLELGDFVQPAIWHFTGHPKPWKRFADGTRLFESNRFYRAYRVFLRNTPWKSWIAAQWGISDLFKNLRFDFHIRLKGSRPAHILPLPTRSRRASVFRNYALNTPFIDVEQKIAVRDPAGLRCKPELTGARRQT